MKHVPNLLSLARLLMSPYLFFVFWRREYKLALVVIAIAGITDGLDGLLARRFGGASRLGAYLDPIADKVMLSGTFVTLALDGAIETWLAVLVLGRDVGILLFAGAMFLFTKSVRSFPPSIWGKASTAVQILFVLALASHFAGFVGEPVVTTLKWVAVLLTAWSGLDYLWRACLINAGK
jgi:cardiolipin synthase